MKYNIIQFPSVDFNLIKTIKFKDIYYDVSKGYLKLKHIFNESPYFISYTPDKGKRYYKNIDINHFNDIFEDILSEHLILNIERKIYKYECFTIYFDTINNDIKYIKIKEINNSNNYNKLFEILGLVYENYILDSYKDIILKNINNRDLNYYKNTNKIFWTLNDTINEYLIDNQTIPCIFVEKKENIYYILQLDLNIKYDDYKYTGWRRLIGKIYNIYVDVLLIASNDKLYTLDGQIINFYDLKRSNVIVDKKYLGKFDINQII